MKKGINFIVVVSLICIVNFSEKSFSQTNPQSSILNPKSFTNPVWVGADPWVIQKDGYYYFCESGGNAIKVSKSKYLTRKQETVKVWDAPKETWNSVCVWAPELHFFRGKWFIYYTAGSSGPPYINQRAGVLEAKTDDPLGEYIDRGMLITSDNPSDPKSAIWAIDLTAFEIKGKLYCVWSGWDKPETTDATVQHLFIAPMSNPYTISGKRVKISSPVEPWEIGTVLNLNEGPEPLYHGNDFFIVYSCRESWLKDYRLGLLKLKSLDSDPLDPKNWTKHGPMFTGTDDIYGVGHSSYTKSPDGKEDWIIYHSKISDKPGWERDVRLQKFTWDKDGLPVFGKPIKPGVPVLKPSGEK